MASLTELNQNASRRLEQGDYLGAVEYCTDIIDNYSLPSIDLHGFYMYRGIAYGELDKLDLAIKDFETCLNLISSSDTGDPMFKILMGGIKENVEKRLSDLRARKD